MTPSRPRGGDVELLGDDHASSSPQPPDSTTSSGSKRVMFAPGDWVRSAAASVSSATGRLATATAGTLRRPMGSFSGRNASKQRSAVNPLAMAATTAQVQTRTMLNEDGEASGRVCDGGGGVLWYTQCVALYQLVCVYVNMITYLNDTQTLSGAVEDFPDRPGDDDVRRTIFLDAGLANDGFCTNRVVTAKYNVLTFLPIFLFEMFSRLAYLYFLLQVVLGCCFLGMLHLHIHTIHLKHIGVVCTQLVVHYFLISNSFATRTKTAQTPTTHPYPQHTHNTPTTHPRHPHRPHCHGSPSSPPTRVLVLHWG